MLNPVRTSRGRQQWTSKRHPLEMFLLSGNIQEETPSNHHLTSSEQAVRIRYLRPWGTTRAWSKVPQIPKNVIWNYSVLTYVWTFDCLWPIPPETNQIPGVCLRRGGCLCSLVVKLTAQTQKNSWTTSTACLSVASNISSVYQSLQIFES